jgi:ferredoxin
VTVRVTVDEGACAATGECERICPQVFSVDDIAKVIDPAPPQDLHGAVREAEAACPTGAIGIVE